MMAAAASMASGRTAAGPEDPLAAMEGQFEAARRFVDEWLLQLRDRGAALEDELLAPGPVNLRPEDWAPCLVTDLPSALVSSSKRHLLGSTTT
jgi:hypothetical protein